MCIVNAADFFVDGKKLPNVTRFRYLKAATYVTSDCSMNSDLICSVMCRLRKKSFRLS